MSPSITGIYAGLLTLLFIGLSARVIRVRRRDRIALGDGDNPDLRRAMRVQGNFAEYVPLALILLVLVEMGGGPAWLVHGLGAGLFGGRIAHAYGIGQTEEDYRFRVAGMVLTFAALALAAIILLARSVVS